MRDVIYAVMALSLAFVAGGVWGWNYRGREFDKEAAAIEQSVRQEHAAELDNIKSQLEAARQQLALAERAASDADMTKEQAVQSLADAYQFGLPVAPGELDVINATIREVAR